MNRTRKRLALVVGIAALLVAATSGIMLAAGHTGRTNHHVSVLAATATDGSAATSTTASTSTVSSTRHPTATAASGTGSTGTGGIPPTSAPGAGQITSATLTVDHTSYNGVCGDSGEPFVFTLTVTVTPHITTVAEVDYRWQANANVIGGLPTPTLLFAGEETKKSLTFAVNSYGSDPNGADSWLAVQTWYPVTLTTNQAHFSVNCTAALASVVGSASPATWSGTCGNYQDITLMFTAYLAPMSPSTTSTQSLPWTMTTDVPNSPETGTSSWHPYLTSGNAPVLFNGDGTKAVGFASFYLYVHLTKQDANGSYWLTVTVNGPNNSSISKTVTITKSCN